MKTEIISDKWTTRELRAFIREETQSVNYKFMDYIQSEEKPNPVAIAEFEKLKALGTGNVKAEYIGLGLSHKTKGELLVQARALQEAQQADFFTPEAKREYSEKEEAAYNTTTARYGLDMSQEDFHNFVESMGALDSYISNLGLGSKELLNLYYEADSSKRVNFASYFMETKREAQAGWTTDDFIDVLSEKLTGE